MFECMEAINKYLGGLKIDIDLSEILNDRKTNNDNIKSFITK